MTEINEKEALEKLFQYIQKHEKSPDNDFTKDELKALKRVAQREIGKVYLTGMLNSTKGILVYIGFIIGLYLSIKSGLDEYIKGLIK